MNLFINLEASCCRCKKINSVIRYYNFLIRQIRRRREINIKKTRSKINFDMSSYLVSFFFCIYLSSRINISFWFLISESYILFCKIVKIFIKVWIYLKTFLFFLYAVWSCDCVIHKIHYNSKFVTSKQSIKKIQCHLKLYLIFVNEIMFSIRFTKGFIKYKI